MKPLVYALISVLLLSTTACNTLGGIGRDVRSAGEVIEDVAD